MATISLLFIRYVLLAFITTGQTDGKSKNVTNSQQTRSGWIPVHIRIVIRSLYR